MDTYSEDVERKMKQLFAWLSQMGRRRYAAVEALKRGKSSENGSNPRRSRGNANTKRPAA